MTLDCLKWHFLLAAYLLAAAAANAQLAVDVAPLKLSGQKAILPLTLRNGLVETVESARAVCFVLDDQGKMVAQATRWVIGGTKDRPALEPGATNTFHFVVASDKTFATTNLTAKLTFTRLVLEGGKQGDPKKDVAIVAQPAAAKAPLQDPKQE
jgi:hypothetical protein